jgi:hypothetical protein
MQRPILATVSQLFSSTPLAIDKGDLPEVLGYHDRMSRRGIWHARFPDGIETAPISNRLKAEPARSTFPAARNLGRFSSCKPLLSGEQSLSSRGLQWANAKFRLRHSSDSAELVGHRVGAAWKD